MGHRLAATAASCGGGGVAAAAVAVVVIAAGVAPLLTGRFAVAVAYRYLAGDDSIVFATAGAKARPAVRAWEKGRRK